MARVDRTVAWVDRAVAGVKREETRLDRAMGVTGVMEECIWG